MEKRQADWLYTNGLMIAKMPTGIDHRIASYVIVWRRCALPIWSLQDPVTDVKALLDNPSVFDIIYDISAIICDKLGYFSSPNPDDICIFLKILTDYVKLFSK